MSSSSTELPVADPLQYEDKDESVVAPLDSEYSMKESTLASQPRAHGAGFRDDEKAVGLPHNKCVLFIPYLCASCSQWFNSSMPLVMTGLAITMFLASLDNTIVTTALPTITAELHGTASDYSWTGVAYVRTPRVSNSCRCLLCTYTPDALLRRVHPALGQAERRCGAEGA
jgi:hypothetical protein